MKFEVSMNPKTALYKLKKDKFLFTSKAQWVKEEEEEEYFIFKPKIYTYIIIDILFQKYSGLGNL